MVGKNIHNFDEYLVQGESSYRQKAEDWQIAIGLQAVDGLTPSTYLLQAAKRHIKGDISIDEVKDLIDTYYRTKSGHDAPAPDTEEADKVSANITKLLNEQTFSFSPSGYAAVHKRIFDGVFKFADVFRDCNITKKKWNLKLADLYTQAKKMADHSFSISKFYDKCVRCDLTKFLLCCILSCRILQMSLDIIEVYNG